MLGCPWKIQKKTLVYLTYTGLLKAFFITRNNNTEHFVNWSMRTLFAAHLGSDKDRTRVASETGIFETILSYVFYTYITYVYILCTAKELRNKRNMLKF